MKNRPTPLTYLRLLLSTQTRILSPTFSPNNIIYPTLLLPFHTSLIHGRRRAAAAVDIQPQRPAAATLLLSVHFLASSAAFLVEPFTAADDAKLGSARPGHRLGRAAFGLYYGSNPGAGVE
nr:hypothetical protein Iba_scaffold34888CG0120 [Ipomoea batatas]GMD62260.1 hypothetical protein Iba_chr12bCG3740 [Ipomoea batatas]